METIPERGRQLRSLITRDGQLVLSLEDASVAPPVGNEVLIRIDAAPINPSDIGLLTSGLDMTEATQSGADGRRTVSRHVPPRLVRALRARIGQSMPAGSEGTGIVIAAGPSAAAQALLGQRISCLGGEMFAEYRTIDASVCMSLPADVTPAEGASCFVNPLTALSFVETMRAEGHVAIVHTAAASSLGQMLIRICRADGVALVNIVRKDEQVQLLREQGATHVLNATSPSFMPDLVDAVAETGATIGFDAVGGGPLAGQILAAMAAAANRNATGFQRYGSDQATRVYIYGRLDLSQTVLSAGVGFAWNLGGYLLTPFLKKVGPDVRARMQKRVADELRTTFATRYTRTISLTEALDLDVVRAYSAQRTGEKYLVDPRK